jgi:hypothetical protein
LNFCIAVHSSSSSTSDSVSSFLILGVITLDYFPTDFASFYLLLFKTATDGRCDGAFETLELYDFYDFKSSKLFSGFLATAVYGRAFFTSDVLLIVSSLAARSAFMAAFLSSVYFSF